MKTIRLIAPNGKTITGTLEQLQGRANATRFELDDDGTLRPDYHGDTDVWWEGQETVTRDGQMVLVDREGNEFTLDQCTQVEVADDDESDDE